MDGSTVDHSDSDSGESWTLLENHPAYGDDAPDFAEHTSAPFERGHPDTNLEKDEDTDGISIISDSDPESGPCDISCDKCLPSENRLPKPQDNPHPCPETPNKKTMESICNEDDFLGDCTHKLKTYVHKRNKRLSMVLNIIMLGSVITAAGVAIGHMWGAKNECATPIPSVNKILSNLYKLQEENAYLRNKLKELTLSGHVQQVQLPKSDEHKKSEKQYRCKKIFEEPLDVKADKASKCIDEDNAESVKIVDSSELLLHEKEFLNDISKLKKVYNQNRSWLDGHIQRRLNHENNLRIKRNTKAGDPEVHKDQLHSNRVDEMKPSFKLPNLEEHDEIGHTLNKDFRIPESDKGAKPLNAWKLGRQVGKINTIDHLKRNKQNKNQEIKMSETTKVPHRDLNLEAQISETPKPIASFESFETIELNSQGISNEVPITKEKKISYADSLKTDTENLRAQTTNESNELPIKEVKGYVIYKRKHGDVDLMLNLISSSEDEIKKDDRYTGPKMKRDKKKHDRHKIHKKQKRKNKYEQWEMKGGYMKDFDEFSMTSSQANLGNDALIPDKKYLNQDFENYLIKLTEADEKKPNKDVDKVKPENKGDKPKKGKNKNKDPEWYDKRYTLRAEARRKLEQELFGESSPNTAAWYFRRMNKREQCRAQKDNSTFKKISKQKMNFKMKH